MTLQENVRYILSPLIRFRRETHRCIGYRLDDFFHTTDNLTLLHPREVIFLMLFDGSRTIKEIDRNYSTLFLPQGKTTDVQKYFDTLQQRFNLADELVVDSNSLDACTIAEINNRYDPNEFLIDVKDINMDFGNLRLDSPLSVNFNICTRCGFACQYCYHPLPAVNEYISLDRLKDIFKEMHDIHIESVLFTGGDPMLRPDIDEVMIEAAKAGLFFTLSTKSILSDDRIRRLHDEAGLDRFLLSIDSFSAQTVHDLIGAPLDYVDRFRHMIGTMQALEMDARLKSVFTSVNGDEIDDYLQNLVELNTRYAQIVAYGRSEYRHHDGLFASKRQRDHANQAIEDFKKLHPEITLTGGRMEPTYDEPVVVQDIEDQSERFKKRVSCNAGRFQMELVPTGEVFICEHLPYQKEFVLGDLRKESIMECWNSDRMKAWLSPPPREVFAEGVPCRACPEPDYQLCHTKFSRCLRYSREIFQTVNAPDIHCPHATFKKRRTT